MLPLSHAWFDGRLGNLQTYDRGRLCLPSSFTSLYSRPSSKLDISTVCLNPSQGALSAASPAASHGMFQIRCVPNLSSKSHTTRDDSPSILLSQQGGHSRPNPTDENMFQHWPESAGRTENSRIAQPILPNPSASSVRVPESRLSSSRTSRIARQPSKSFSPVASGSGTSHAPTMTQAQPPIDAERSSFVGSAQTGVSNPESGDITVFISPDLIRGSSVASGALGGVGGQLETGSAQRPGEN
jgi:hypothetical protein